MTRCGADAGGGVCEGVDEEGEEGGGEDFGAEGIELGGRAGNGKEGSLGV